MFVAYHAVFDHLIISLHSPWEHIRVLSDRERSSCAFRMVSRMLCRVKQQPAITQNANRQMTLIVIIIVAMEGGPVEDGISLRRQYRMTWLLYYYRPSFRGNSERSISPSASGFQKGTWWLISRNKFYK